MIWKYKKGSKSTQKIEVKYDKTLENKGNQWSKGYQNALQQKTLTKISLCGPI